ncbi:hypothetical protein [Dictyobacter arantiisoli]|uniref:Uncharacterized protein n=1 Tax=Dictyobacter arantiisoli TaxID=2014874 RepID=A0A5A5TJ57_9CHLR|nr:hypothetical protein [Dictyobacter arantiisoli]GCF11641.1 hypothetical protein KDI_52050 [Dictyobacter arantiisoli]
MRSFNQLVAEYQEHARLTATIDESIVRLHAENVPFMQAAQVLIRVVDFEDARLKLQSYALWENELRLSDTCLQLNEEYKEYVQSSANMEQVIVNLHTQHTCF